MLSFLRSKQDKKIEQLFGIYKTALASGKTPEESLLDVWGEAKNSDGLLKTQYGYSERSVESKKQLIRDMFNDPLDVTTYDIYKTVTFIITWESPTGSFPTIEQIRNGTDTLSVLSEKVKKIGDTIL